MPHSDGGTTRPGFVSVITINYRGTDDTLRCLDGLRELDWPADRLEIICVDNASGDDSVQRIREAAPDVTVIESATNTGFAGGCNLGAEHAHGEYVAFLNNDARPDPQWLAAAADVLAADDGVACVASRVLDWSGEHIDFAGGGVTWFGMGYSIDAGSPIGQVDEARDVLFATGAAMIVRAEVYRKAGGFDDQFFMFYEDVDFGWRLNLMGQRVRYVPQSVAYHRHHATMDKFAPWRERFLLERNALLVLYKNLSDENLAKVLAPALLLLIRRSFETAQVDTGQLDLRVTSAGEDQEATSIPKMALCGPFAVDQFLQLLPAAQASRLTVQALRRRTDPEVLALSPELYVAMGDSERYLGAWDSLLTLFNLVDEGPAIPWEQPIGLLDRYAMVAKERAVAITTLTDRLERAAARARRADDRRRRLEERFSRADERRQRAETALKSTSDRLAQADERVAQMRAQRRRSLRGRLGGLKRRARRVLCRSRVRQGGAQP